MSQEFSTEEEPINTDINTRYQSAQDRNDAKSIVEVAQDFISCALTYGRMIIDEWNVSEDQRTLKPLGKASSGQLGGRKYLVRDILFKVSTSHSLSFSISHAHSLSLSLSLLVTVCGG